MVNGISIIISVLKVLNQMTTVVPFGSVYDEIYYTDVDI